MGAYSNIVRLARPANLLIVAITMFVVRYAVLKPLMEAQHIGMKWQLTTFDFLLLVLSAVMLTAAGNVINDYFDQKVDRINKPEKVIVGKTVKRRVAIILHQVLNGGSLLLTVYICARTSFWWPMLLPAVISTLLWWYSPVFKKKAFLGNFVVACCTASVPIWAAVFEIHEMKESYSDMMVEPSLVFNNLWLWVSAIAGFAFLLTLVREAVKDIEDIEGDAGGEYHTLPIAYGISFTKKYALVILTVFILFLAYCTSRLYTSHSIWALVAVLVLVMVPAVNCIFLLLRANDKLEFHKVSTRLKIVMSNGLVALILLTYLLKI